jgi:PAS domain S-box-containing protein
MPSGTDGELATLLGRIRSGGIVEHYETVRVRKDVSRVQVSLSLSPIHDDAGVVIGASTIARDITERRQNEEALRKSEAMLTTAESVAQLGSWRWDLSTQRVAWSQGMFRLFAVDPADFDGDFTKVLAERVHPDDRAAVQKATASVLESGVPVPVEYRLLLPDGSARIVHGEGRAERDAAGEMVAVVGCYQDVTERRSTEASLRESEERFRGLVENISDVITSYDLDLRFRYLSPSFSRFMGVDSQSLVGKTHREAGLPEELSDRLDDALRQALKSRQAVDLEFVMPRASRETVAEVRVFPEFDAEGRPAGVVTVTHDVTARRLAEREVQLARQRLALHVEQTPLAVIEFDLGGRVQEWNPAAAMVFGYPRDEALGRNWSFIVPEAARAHVDETWAAIVGQSGGQRSTNDNVTKDGRTVNCEWFNTPLVSPDGQTIGVASLIQDVTERRQSERQLGDTVLRLVAITDGVIAALSRAVEVRDPYTAGHERRVSELAAAIAHSLGLGGEIVQHVQIAGRLHDIGKITIPAEILSKPGRLSEMEFMLIKGHPQAAYDILESIEFDFPLAEIVVQHHERLDGSGYPNGLAGDAILPEARILAVADVIEAMASHRPYRAALPLEAAMAEIEDGAGVRYDAAACEAATRLFREQGFTFSE